MTIVRAAGPRLTFEQILDRFDNVREIGTDGTAPVARCTYPRASKA